MGWCVLFMLRRLTDICDIHGLPEQVETARRKLDHVLNQCSAQICAPVVKTANRSFAWLIVTIAEMNRAYFFKRDELGRAGVRTSRLPIAQFGLSRGSFWAWLSRCRCQIF
jgi:hypothetical protein